MTEQPKDYATPQEKLAEQDWAGVTAKGIMAMAPADKGWILAVVIIVTVLQLGDTVREWIGEKRSERVSLLMNNQMTAMEVHRSDELRRCQESIKERVQAEARQYEYQGRARHESRLLSPKSESE
jgi:hypothetical protein